MTQQVQDVQPRGSAVRVLLTIALLLGACTLGAIAAVYMLPTIVAALSRSERVKSIAIANALIGWTIIGWLAMLWITLWPHTSGGEVIYVVQQPAPPPDEPGKPPDELGKPPEQPTPPSQQ